MAFDLLRSAKHIRGLSHPEFRVLFYLLESANQETMECYPSLKKIGEFTDMAPRTVQRHITTLAERGLFERIERRRTDGSRSSNCYRFHAVGSMKIGREIIIKLGVETDEEIAEQHATSGVLQNDDSYTPDVASPTATSDATTSHMWRDLKNQESEPVIEPESPNGDVGDRDLFGKAADSKIVTIRDPSIIDFVKVEWEKLKEELGENIADCRAVTDYQAKLIRDRGREHAKPGETGFDVWRIVFQNIRASRFLRGEAPPGFGRSNSFRLSLSKLLKSNIFGDTVNGTYSDKSAEGDLFDANGRRLGPAAQATRSTIERLRSARERGNR